MTLPQAETSSSFPDGKGINDFLTGAVSSSSFNFGGSEFAIQLVDVLRDDAGSGITSFKIKTARSGDVYIRDAELIFYVNGFKIHTEQIGTPIKGAWETHKYSIVEDSFSVSGRTLIDGYVARPGASLKVEFVSNTEPNKTATVTTTIPKDSRPQYKKEFENTGPFPDNDSNSSTDTANKDTNKDTNKDRSNDSAILIVLFVVVAIMWWWFG